MSADIELVGAAARTAGMMEKWPRESIGRPNWRATLAICPGSRTVPAAAVTPDSVCDITALPHAARELVPSGGAGHRAHGATSCSPTGRPARERQPAASTGWGSAWSRRCG